MAPTAMRVVNATTLVGVAEPGLLRLRSLTVPGHPFDLP